MYPQTFDERLRLYAVAGLDVGGDLRIRGKTGVQLVIELGGETFDLIKSGRAWWLSKENNHHNRRVWIGSHRLQWCYALGRAAAYLKKRSDEMKKKPA